MAQIGGRAIIPRIVVYSAICGDYPVSRDDEVVCFGDDGIFHNKIMEAKRYKVLPHLFFPQREITVWVDGNIGLKVIPDEITEKFLGDADMALFVHPYNATVWKEFDVLQHDRRFDIMWLKSKLFQQIEFYKEEGLPDDTPLWECGFMVRRNNERVNRLMEAWWAQICRWQWRDQVSFPYVLWKYGQDVKINAITGNVRKHESFTYANHYL